MNRKKYQTLGGKSELVLENIAHRRRKAGRAYVEGNKVVHEALAGSWNCHVLLLNPTRVEEAEREELIAAAESRGAAVYHADDGGLKKLSDCETPPPVGLIVSPPHQPKAHELELSGPLLILDSLSDPGNVGTMIRCAAAFNFRVVLSAGGVSPLNEKMLRSTAGNIFRKGLLYHSLEVAPLRDRLFEVGYRVVVLDAAADRALNEASIGAEDIALVVGNEAHGINWEVWHGVERWRIPMASGVESLNAAITGAIAMYEIARGRQ